MSCIFNEDTPYVKNDLPSTRSGRSFLVKMIFFCCSSVTRSSTLDKLKFVFPHKPVVIRKATFLYKNSIFWDCPIYVCLTVRQGFRVSYVKTSLKQLRHKMHDVDTKCCLQTRLIIFCPATPACPAHTPVPSKVAIWIFYPSQPT